MVIRNQGAHLLLCCLERLPQVAELPLMFRDQFAGLFEARSICRALHSPCQLKEGS